MNIETVIIVCACAIAVVALVAVTLVACFRKDDGKGTIITQILAAAAPTVAALLALFQSFRNADKAETLHTETRAAITQAQSDVSESVKTEAKKTRDAVKEK
jgi:Na+/melibiose symporter-like transporter